MANRLKLKGTTEKAFDLGLTNKFTLDATGFTANRTWTLPDSNGTAGYVLSTNGSGALSWVAQTGGGGGSTQARIQFTAGSSGTGQTFTDSGLSSFTNNTFANVFVNGVLLQTSEYSISGTTLTVSRYLSTGDNIIVAATGAGSVVGTLATTSGGTGLSTYTTGDIIYASGTNTLAKRAIGSTGQVLTVSGGVPTWATPASTGYSGVTITSPVNLTNTNETYVTPTFALPTITSGMVYKFECYVRSVSAPGATAYTIRLRIGSTGTISDTQIYTESNSTLAVLSGTITFDGATSIFRVASTEIAASAVSVANPSGPFTGLTPTYLGITAEASGGTPTQYWQIFTANITRVL